MLHTSYLIPNQRHSEAASASLSMMNELLLTGILSVLAFVSSLFVFVLMRWLGAQVRG